MYARRSKEAHEAYRNNSVEMQSKGRLVYLLYEGVIKFISQAEVAIELKQLSVAHENILKAQNIIRELMSTLRLDVGEVAHQLMSLYDYMLHQLIQANVQKHQVDVALPMLAEVKRLVEDLAQTWKEIM